MKWTLRWDDFYGEEYTEDYDDLAKAINRVEEFDEAVVERVERIRLFLNDNHVATYYTPTKGYWE